MQSKAQELSGKYYHNYQNTKATFTIVKTNDFNYGNVLRNSFLKFSFDLLFVLA